jgi:hypothetical protein
MREIRPCGSVGGVGRKPYPSLNAVATGAVSGFTTTVPVAAIVLPCISFDVQRSMELQKGEAFEWSVEDKNTMLLKRRNPLKVRRSAPGQG